MLRYFTSEMLININSFYILLNAINWTNLPGVAAADRQCGLARAWHAHQYDCDPRADRASSSSEPSPSWHSTRAGNSRFSLGGSGESPGFKTAPLLCPPYPATSGPPSQCWFTTASKLVRNFTPPHGPSGRAHMLHLMPRHLPTSTPSSRAPDHAPPPIRT